MSTTSDGRYALVVATARYDDQKLGQLRSPAADAERLATVLRDPAKGNFEVDVLVDATHGPLTRRIVEFFADRRPNDLLLLHFSCHGVKDDRGELYLAARDTEVRFLSATGLKAAWLNDEIGHTRSRRTVLFLDCCFSGSFPLGMRARAGDAVNAPERFGGRGRAIISASSEMEYAYEGDRLLGEGHPSVFTEAIVEGLETGRADLDGDQLISVDDLYTYVYDRVKERTPSQTPNKKSDLQGPLYLAASTYRPTSDPSALGADLSARLEAEDVADRRAAVGELSALMAAADPGIRLAARHALWKLIDDDSRRVSASALAALNRPDAPRAPQVRGESEPAWADATESGRPAPSVAEPAAREQPMAESSPAAAGVQPSSQDPLPNTGPPEPVRSQPGSIQPPKPVPEPAPAYPGPSDAKPATRRRGAVAVIAAGVAVGAALLAGGLGFDLGTAPTRSPTPTASPAPGSPRRSGPPPPRAARYSAAGLAIDGLGRAWAARGDEVVRLDGSGKPTASWPPEGRSHGVAADVEGNVYVAVVNGKRAFIRQIPAAKTGSKQNAKFGSGEISLPAGVKPFGLAVSITRQHDLVFWVSAQHHLLIRRSTERGSDELDPRLCVSLHRLHASPRGLATTSRGRLWVADKNGRLLYLSGNARDPIWASWELKLAGPATAVTTDRRGKRTPHVAWVTLANGDKSRIARVGYEEPERNAPNVTSVRAAPFTTASHSGVGGTTPISIAVNGRAGVAVNHHEPWVGTATAVSNWRRTRTKPAGKSGRAVPGTVTGRACTRV